MIQLELENYHKAFIMIFSNKSPTKVFISYSHDSPEHRTRVLNFAEKLRKDGLDAWIDQYESWPEKGWPLWMEKHIFESDFVLLVCTETYFRRVTNEEDPDVGHGVCWESRLIFNELYSEKLNNKKFIPIFFGESTPDFLPRPLRGYSSYVVDHDADYQQLYAILSRQPAAKPSPLGSLQKMENPERRELGTGTQQSHIPKEPERNYKYFISYTHRNADDENHARYLHDNLTQLGHSVFIDIGMKAGMDWLAEIRGRIQWCDYLVLLLSKTSMRSEMVLREVRMACASFRANGKPQILPIRIHYEGPLEYELDLYIGHLHHVSWHDQKDSQAVLDNITQPQESCVCKTKRRNGKSSSTIRPINDKPDHAMDLRLLSVRDITEEDSKYIVRPEDKKVVAAAHEIGETLVIKAPNQMGKSSLLARYIQECKKVGKKTIVIDFAMFGEDELSSYSNLLSTLAWSINDELEINGGEFPDIKNQPMMVSYIRKRILAETTGPLTIAFDEVDRVMGQSYSTDFFAMLRTFHNSRARTRWGETDLVLVISTEPYLLITESKRSPFNVVPPVVLNPFTFDECAALNKTYDNPLDEAALEELFTLLRGHPYLTRLAYYHLKDTRTFSLEDLIERADDERGPFGEHLRSKLSDLQEGVELMEGMKTVLNPETKPDRDMSYRLHGAGLITFKDHDHAVPANLLYHRYFKRILNV
jgi:hypothetical protein